MKVTLHYWAQVKQAAGLAREEFEVEAPCTAQDLVVRAAEDHGDPLRGFLLGSDGAPHKHLMLIIGDRHVAWDAPYTLEGGEEITLLPPISGGSGRDPLTDAEKQQYEWQMWVPDFGEEGQEKLKNSSVLISRCGGLGGVVAYELAAAGVGRLVIAHAGNVKPSDLNRQLLMTHEGLGKSRVESAARRIAAGSLELRERSRRRTREAQIGEEQVDEAEVARLHLADDLRQTRFLGIQKRPGFT